MAVLRVDAPVWTAGGMASSLCFMGKTDDRYMVPGLARGMEVLRAFSPARPRLSLGELAALLGTTRSALFRVTYTLARLGYLMHDVAAQTFSLGPAVLRLGHGYPAARGLVEAALPLLEGLRDATGWSAHLGVLEGRQVVYMLRLPARAAGLGIVQVGSRLPAHATAMGRVLLAGLEEAALAERYRDVGITAIGPCTPASLAGLLAQARRDGKRGHVVHLGDFESGVASVAAPLRDAADATLAAIALTAPLSEAGRPEALLPRLLACAEEFRAALGDQSGMR